MTTMTTMIMLQSFSDALLNKNHDMPSLPIFLIIAISVILFNSLGRYYLEKHDEQRRNDAYLGKVSKKGGKPKNTNQAKKSDKK